jgi:hypothetical protein
VLLWSKRSVSHKTAGLEAGGLAVPYMARLAPRR